MLSLTAILLLQPCECWDYRRESMEASKVSLWNYLCSIDIYEEQMETTVNIITCIRYRIVH